MPSGAATGFSARMSTDLAAHQETQTPGARPTKIDSTHVRARVDACFRPPPRPTNTAGHVEAKSALLCGFLPRGPPMHRRHPFSPAPGHRNNRRLMEKSILCHDLPGGVVVERLPRGQQPRKLVPQFGPLPRDVRVLG